MTAAAARTWCPDGPGSFLAPADVRAVRDRDGRVWTRGHTRWTCTGSHWIRWRVLVAEHGPVTEVRPPDRSGSPAGSIPVAVPRPAPVSGPQGGGLTQAQAPSPTPAVRTDNYGHP